ncbi:aromatic ring-hydroxylating oxygenase subunit alpha [Aestuariivirga sp.]|uniref:aromatic ring-hydroxylating oxygenase subunit alpha n=1 Tax=Aestuariivirga sp. TaxID=2650926 RepID=UPI0039E441CE
MIEPLNDLLRNVSVPFSQAHAMPPSVYTSAAFNAAEVSDIFARDWVCLGRASALPNPGDYMTYELAGQPIFVMRDRDGSLKAQSNVCLHRMSTLLEGSGNKRSITCPYHGWTYNLDGTLRGAPAMTHNECFDKAQYRLPQLKCENWLGWIMVSLNPDAPPVSEQLGEVEGLIADYGMADYVESFRETHIWDTNWKILAENFMESYHLPVCHAGTIGGLSRLDDMICPAGRRAFNYHTILKDDRLKIALAHPNNMRMTGERRRTTFLLAIYPSLLITLTPGYFWYLSLHPHGPGQVRIIFGGGLSPDFAIAPEAQEHFAELKVLLDEVNVEDRGCTERVFRGVSAGAAKAGHLSHLERPNFDFAQYIAEKLGGFERRFDPVPMAAE